MDNHTINNQLSELNHALYEITGNDVFFEVPYTNLDGEIGEMARAIDKLKDITETRNKTELELYQFKKQIEEQNIEMEFINEEIIHQKEEILSAIRYSKKIQNALLPPRNFLDDNFPDNFLIYLPKDYVSGDFYWHHKSGETHIIIVADCTGHGVPGAMLTLLGIMMFDEAVVQQSSVSPAQILSRVSKKIKEKLESEKNENQNDGMDVSVIMIKGNEIEYSGAGRSLFFIDKNGLNIIKGDKRSLGDKRINSSFQFTNHKKTLESGTRIIMTSDGYTDQIGENGKKFGTKYLKKLLGMNYNSISDLGIQLELFLQEHKGYQEQRDDITVLGFTLP